MKALYSYLDDEAGASAAEYALILAVIGTAVVASLTFLGSSISTAVNSVASFMASSS